MRVRTNDKIEFDFDLPPQIDSTAVVRVTDLFLTIAKLKNGTISSVILSVTKLLYLNQSVSYIEYKDLGDSILEGPVLIISESNDTHVIWDGHYGDLITIDGQFCTDLSCEFVEKNE